MAQVELRARRSRTAPSARVITPLVILALVVASWALRPRSRALGAAEASLDASDRRRVPVAA